MKSSKILLSVSILAMAFSAPAAFCESYSSFVSRKGLQQLTSDSLSLYRDKDDLFLELPASVNGKVLSVSTFIRNDENLMFPAGMEISAPGSVWTAEIADSTLVLRTSAGPLAISGNVSAPGPLAFRLRAVCGDGNGSMVFKANSLFDLSSSMVVSFAGRSSGNFSVSKGNAKKENWMMRGISLEGGCLSVSQDATAEIEGSSNLGGISISGDPIKEHLCYISVFQVNDPADIAPLRFSDPHIGTPTVPARIFSETRGVVDKKIASRWNLSDGKKIKVYVDTLVRKEFANAVRDGFLAWNDALEKAGAGSPIEVLPFPSDTAFSMFDPSVCMVRYGPPTSTSSSVKISRNRIDGEITGFAVSLPGDYCENLRRKGLSIGYADPRFLEYDIDINAQAEVLRYDVMRIAGQCLGLSRNFAGSLAYSPDQLSSAEFTRSNGITASILDNVPFNVFAEPGGDAVLIADRLGPYDYFAIDWLYREFPEGVDAEAALRQLATSHEGDPRYLYAESSILDPRAQGGDLSSDPAAFCKTYASRIKAILPDMYERVTSMGLSSQSQSVMVEIPFVTISNAVLSTRRWIGGQYISPARPGSSSKPMESVPEQMQRAAASAIFETVKGLSDFDSDRRLVHLGGPYRDLSSFGKFYVMNGFGAFDEILRLAWNQYNGGTYTLDEYLEELCDFNLDLLSGNSIGPMGDGSFSRLVSALCSYSKSSRANYPDGVNAIVRESCHKAAKDLRKDIKKLKSRMKADSDRAKLDYYIQYINNNL